MITCIILAAGLSQRFGSPKALAILNQETIIEHIQQTLLQSNCDEILIVLGAHADAINPYVFNHKRIRIVYNKDYNFGATTSLKIGVEHCNPTTDAILFWPVDCPFINYLTINTLIEAFNAATPDIIIPSYKDRRGHPPIFNHRLAQEILALPLNLGLNSLFEKYPPQTLNIDDPSITQSFNTPEELEHIK